MKRHGFETKLSFREGLGLLEPLLKVGDGGLQSGQIGLGGPERIQSHRLLQQAHDFCALGVDAPDLLLDRTKPALGGFKFRSEEELPIADYGGVELGDLVEAAGDGVRKKQADFIVQLLKPGFGRDGRRFHEKSRLLGLGDLLDLGLSSTKSQGGLVENPQLSGQVIGLTLVVRVLFIHLEGGEVILQVLAPCPRLSKSSAKLGVLKAEGGQGAALDDALQFLTMLLQSGYLHRLVENLR